MRVSILVRTSPVPIRVRHQPRKNRYLKPPPERLTTTYRVDSLPAILQIMQRSFPTFSCSGMTALVPRTRMCREHVVVLSDAMGAVGGDRTLKSRPGDSGGTSTSPALPVVTLTPRASRYSSSLPARVSHCTHHPLDAMPARGESFPAAGLGQFGGVSRTYRIWGLYCCFACSRSARRLGPFVGVGYYPIPDRDPEPVRDRSPQPP